MGLLHNSLEDRPYLFGDFSLFCRSATGSSASNCSFGFSQGCDSELGSPAKGRNFVHRQLNRCYGIGIDGIWTILRRQGRTDGNVLVMSHVFSDVPYNVTAWHFIDHSIGVKIAKGIFCLNSQGGISFQGASSSTSERKASGKLIDCKVSVKALSQSP